MEDKKVKYPVRLRGGFSDRNKIKPENILLQLDSLDNRSRVAIINLVNLIHNLLLERLTIYNNEMQSFYKAILSNVYL